MYKTTTVTVAVCGCPTPVASNNGPICAGSALSLSVNPNLPTGVTATYVWSGPAGSSTQQNPIIPNMTPAKAGVYNVTVTYSNGCTGTASTNVAVNPKPTITAITPSCVGGAGRITVVATNAVTYGIPGTTNSTGIFNGLSAGTYTVTVTSAAGCTKTATVTVAVCGCPTPVASNNGPICAGSALSLSVNPNLPTGVTATYAWSGPAGSSTQQNPIIPNMTPAKAGVYNVTVTYSNGCTGTASTNVALSPAPVVTISGPASFCAGSSATLTTSGGAYAWSNGGNSASINVTTAGTYTVTVTSAAGCTKTATKLVTVTALPAISANVICGTNGATVTISGSATSYTLNGVTQSSNIFTGVANGTYTVSATNAAACVGTTNVTVNCNTCAAEVGDITVSSVVCPGDPFVVTPNFNSPAVGYDNYVLVVNAAGVIVEVAPATSGVTQTLSTSTAGTYNVYAYSVQAGGTVPSVGTNVSAISGNCFDLSNPPKQAILPESPLALVGYQNSDEGNEGGITPFHYNTDTVLIVGGLQPYNFDWEIIGYVRYDITYTETGTEVIIYYSDDAQWNAIVTDSYGCANDSLYFTNMQGSTDNTILDIDAYEVTPSSDYTAPDGSINLTVTGGNTSCGTYSYEWSGPDTWTPSFPTTGTAPAIGGNQYVLAGLPMGWYSVTVTDCIGNVTEGWYWVPASARGRTKAVETLSVMPNPFADKAIVEFTVNVSGNTTVNVYSIDGKQVATLYNATTQAGETYQVTLDGANLPSGMYFVKMTNANGETMLQKAMISR
ncbi:MAG: T9SS type A sorting domain-containing protein [Sphingobacteriales bacterium]|nr:T9SS type A sorting domain-containing protein [Sphingobacteriales bacterium]